MTGLRPVGAIIAELLLKLADRATPTAPSEALATSDIRPRMFSPEVNDNGNSRDRGAV